MYLNHIKREQRLNNGISRWLFRGNILGDMSPHSPGVDAYALKNGPHPFPTQLLKKGILFLLCWLTTATASTLYFNLEH